MPRRLRFRLHLFLPFLAFSLLTGCAMKRPIYVDPDIKSARIAEIVVLPPIDLRVDKQVSVDLDRQVQARVANALKRRGYQVTTSGDPRHVSEISLEVDLREAEPGLVRRLGPAGARYVMVLCLLDVTTEVGWGSSGAAELTGYLYDKEKAIVVWRDKGLGESSQAGLVYIAMAPTMSDDAIAKALGGMMASFPKAR